MILSHIPSFFCTLILHGGVGNQLLQLEALLTLNSTSPCPIVIGYFRHPNRHISSYYPWGGHPRPKESTWCEFVEGIDCLPPGLWDRVEIRDERNAYNFDIGVPDEYIPLPDLYKPYTALNGYFFNYRYRSGLLKWKSWLVTWARDTLRSISANSECVTIVHLRRYYSGEPSPKFAHSRTQPSDGFYRRAVAMFSYCFVLVLSDKRMSSSQARKITGRSDAVFLSEDCPVRSLVLMDEATHLVAASSTLSGYAATRKKNGLSVIWKGFEHTHGREFMHPGALNLVWLK